MNVVPYGQGKAKPATEDDLNKDNSGFTNPNLHVRIDVKSTEPGQVEPPKYDIGIYGYDQYRIKTTYIHDENSDDSEIP